MNFKLISLNIHKGFNTTNTRYTIEDLKAALEKEAPDFCMFQEISGLSKEVLKYHPKYNQIGFLAYDHWPFHSYGMSATFKNRNHGNAVLSKFPIALSKNNSITVNKYEQRGFQHVIINLIKDGSTDNNKTRLSVTKSSAIKSSRLASKNSNSPTSGSQNLSKKNYKQLHIVNTHLNLITKDRLAQIKTIAQYIYKNIPSDAALILGGDFNDYNYFVDKYLTADFDVFGFPDNTKLMKSAPWPKTFPSFLPALSLDRLYTKNLKLVSLKALSGNPWKNISDHLPLVIEFKV